MSKCSHEEFSARVDVTRVEMMEEVGGFFADVRVRCVRCGAFFTFEGVEAQGLSLRHPTTNLEGTELRIPIKPPTVSEAS